ncbi:hypothetical protein GF402_01695 [Candidatus Fermentibacteria bacterium]|nr:hypothetical protein [Candidatus Fermentibacteria bacterium]
MWAHDSVNVKEHDSMVTDPPRTSSEHGRYILLSDIGSTTTKAMLVERTGDFLSIADEISSPTTVEKPLEDVKIGITKAFRALEDSTGLKLLDDSGEPAHTYLTTSSAGGGLQILVFGLTGVDTGHAASMAAQGAGGVILRTVTIDEEIPPVEKMRLIRDLHPDLILMAGGTDGGAIGGVVHLAEVLTLADPQPKFSQREKIPLVFCGNKEAQPFVRRVLQENFDLHVVRNIRPTLTELETRPATKEIHRLFMENVMERAPGYSEVKDWTDEDILPTPVGVERMLRLYEEEMGENAVMIDMGGATTDVFSSIAGGYNRTVSANMGMSYSICNILASSGIDKILRYLPEGYGEREVRDYVAGKMLHPTYIPHSVEERLLEQAVAVRGIRTAWKQHREMSFKTANLGCLDRLKKLLLHRDKFEYTFLDAEKAKFGLKDIDTIIGTGGILTHTGGTREALWMLAEGAIPHGVTKLAVEKAFRSPHLGVLSVREPQAALELYRKECLVEVGYVVAPTGWIRRGKPALDMEGQSLSEPITMRGGEIRFLPRGGKLSFRTHRWINLNGSSEANLDTELPVLIDCRGRGEEMIDAPILPSDLEIYDQDLGERFSVVPPPPGCSITGGEFELEIRLPYEGDIVVGEGDAISAGDTIGQNRFAPPRLYILDVHGKIGYDQEIDFDDLMKGFKIEPGESLSVGQEIFRWSEGGFGGKTFLYESPVRGLVLSIARNGMVIAREIQDYDGKPHRIDVAGPLRIKPRAIKGYLRKRKGDFVERGEAVAKDVGKGVFVRSPSAGLVKKVDTKKGTITVQYDLEPVAVSSIVNGTVTRVEKGYSAWVSYRGETLSGAIGFGPQCCGRAVSLQDGNLPGDAGEGSILFSTRPVDTELLEAASTAGVSGLVAPSLHCINWVGFSGRELGVALTGEENIPFGIILTEGFGDLPASESATEFFRRWECKTVGLSPRTQIRAGVTRPQVVGSEG